MTALIVFTVALVLFICGMNQLDKDKEVKRRLEVRKWNRRRTRRNIKTIIREIRHSQRDLKSAKQRLENNDCYTESSLQRNIRTVESDLSILYSDLHSELINYKKGHYMFYMMKPKSPMSPLDISYRKMKARIS